MIGQAEQDDVDAAAAGGAEVTVDGAAGDALRAGQMGRAQVLRGVYEMTSDKSPSGLLRVMKDDRLDGNEWRYLCYSAVSLAEVLRPLSTMQGIEG